MEISRHPDRENRIQRKRDFLEVLSWGWGWFKSNPLGRYTSVSWCMKVSFERV